MTINCTFKLGEKKQNYTKQTTTTTTTPTTMNRMRRVTRMKLKALQLQQQRDTSAAPIVVYRKSLATGERATRARARHEKKIRILIHKQNRILSQLMQMKYSNYVGYDLFCVALLEVVALHPSPSWDLMLTCFITCMRLLRFLSPFAIFSVSSLSFLSSFTLALFSSLALFLSLSLSLTQSFSISLNI